MRTFFVDYSNKGDLMHPKADSKVSQPQHEQYTKTLTYFKTIKYQ